MLSNRGSRRAFLGTLGSVASVAASRSTIASQEELQATDSELTRILNSPVLSLEGFREPITIESIELLRNGNTHLLRTRSTSGVEVITVPHQAKIPILAPILIKNVIPAFLNKDARQLENLLWDVYRHVDNYKMQGLALWVSVAAVEMGLIELLCQSQQLPIGQLFGGKRKDQIGIYFASGKRGNSPEEEIEYLQSLVAASGAKALKFRLGGRMSRNADSAPGRSEGLIALARKTFGDEMTLYADSNSSYDRFEAIRIGRIMQEYGYGFFEEPCEFDDLWGTKAVADALTMPVAGGEQEYSMHRWKWAIVQRGVDIVQPDLHYGGGLIRATQVARMAAHVGMKVVPHMSGGGLGYLEVIHFASFTPNAGPFMEFKGGTGLPVHCATSTLKSEAGYVTCPTGIGFGVEIDADFVKKASVVKL